MILMIIYHYILRSIKKTISTIPSAPNDSDECNFLNDIDECIKIKEEEEVHKSQDELKKLYMKTHATTMVK